MAHLAMFILTFAHRQKTQPPRSILETTELAQWGKKAPNIKTE